MAYYNLDPFGNERLDYQGAKIAWATFEVHRDRKRKADAFEVKDFMPGWGEGPKRQTVEQQIAMAKMITIGMGGKVG